MTTRNKLVVLIGVLALSVAPALGCGGDPPPGDNDNQQQNDNQDNNDDNTNNDNGDDCEDDDDCGADESCDDGQCIFDPECEDQGDCADGEVCQSFECVEMDYDCELDENFFGQLGGSGDIENAGGNPTQDPLEHDAGLDEVVDKIDDEVAAYDGDIGDDSLEIELEESIEIEEATVTAVEFRETGQFWLEDSEAQMYVFLTGDDEPISEEDAPNVGDRVSFSADELGVFRGDPQIQGLSDWEIVDSDTDVPYIELGDEQLDKEEHFGRIARAGGQLYSEFDCGEDIACFNMRYGPQAEGDAVFVTPSDYDEVGDCVTFVGPIQTFPGYYVEDSEAQFSADNAPGWGDAWYTVEFD